MKNLNITIEDNNLECEISFTYKKNKYTYSISGAEYAPCFLLYRNDFEIMRLCENIPRGSYSYAFSLLESREDFEVIKMIREIFEDYTFAYFSRSPKFITLNDVLDMN